MYFKEQRYEKAKASTLAATHTVELPDSGLIDSLSLYLRCTNAADLSAVAPCSMWQHLTKIEVIGDNDKTLFSMSAENAIAKAYRKMGALPPFKQNEYNGKSQDLLIPLLFGRRYKDGKYALDLSKWDKVELKVTNNYTTSFITSGSLSMETRMCTLEDSVEAHAKFLKQWDYEDTAPVAATDYKYIKLPTKGLLRSMMVQLDPTISATTGAMTADPAGDNYNWKLYLKDRALMMYDHRPRDIMRDEHRRLGVGHSSAKIYPSATKYPDLHWAEVIANVITQLEATADQVQPSCGDSRDRFQNLGYAGVGNVIQAKMLGVGLFHTFEIPFYLPEDEETNYFNLDAYKPVEIEWYTYNIYHTHRLILEKPIGQGPAEYA